MRRSHRVAPEPSRRDIDEAIAALTSEQLRELVRDMLLELDDRAHNRLASTIIDRAARGSSRWAPAPPSEAEVAEAVAFAQAATTVGHAEPFDIDEHLRRGAATFLRKDYSSAHRIFGALLRPIAEGEIHLGQHEMIDEVLGVDANECAVEHVVSAYMISDPSRRAEAVRSAIDEVWGVGYFFEPLRDMERAALEPLPGLDEFLPQWRAILAREAGGERRGEWDTEVDRWLREVIQRMEGATGLAKLARSTQRPEDLQAWCETLIASGDWKAALAAFEEATELIAVEHHARGEFLDGAALAAQELGEKDLSPWLERAWRGAPSMLRLRRWLGVARGMRAIRKRAVEALEACPEWAYRQRAFLQVLQEDWEPPAKLLAGAPGLGWSSGEHPGHLLFPLFGALLCGRGVSQSIRLPGYGMEIEGFEPLTSERNGSRLATPDVGDILGRAGIEGIRDSVARKVVLTAMRKATENRVAGVTEQKRRRHYGHAASLVAACVASNPSPETNRWAAALRERHRRFPALRAELDHHLGST